MPCQSFLNGSRAVVLPHLSLEMISIQVICFMVWNDSCIEQYRRIEHKGPWSPLRVLMVTVYKRYQFHHSSTEQISIPFSNIDFSWGVPLIFISPEVTSLRNPLYGLD